MSMPYSPSEVSYYFFTPARPAPAGADLVGVDLQKWK